MQSVPREWLDFLRQQFPKDSRIQLTEIFLQNLLENLLA